MREEGGGKKRRGEGSISRNFTLTKTTKTRGEKRQGKEKQTLSLSTSLVAEEERGPTPKILRLFVGFSRGRGGGEKELRRCST